MTHDIIYRKQGRKYVPVGICQDPQWYPPGCSLVVVDKSCTSIQYQHVTPQAAPILAALRLARDHMGEVVRKAHAMRPRGGATPREKRAWEIMRRELPGDLIMVEWPSIMEIVEAMERELVRLATEQKP